MDIIYVSKHASHMNKVGSIVKLNRACLDRARKNRDEEKSDEHKF